MYAWCFCDAGLVAHSDAVSSVLNHKEFQSFAEKLKNTETDMSERRTAARQIGDLCGIFNAPYSSVLFNAGLSSVELDDEVIRITEEEDCE
jgi:hypothetical protein